VADSEAKRQEATLEVGGMHCDSCAALIQETLAEEPGIDAVRVTRDPDRLELSYDEAAIDLADVAAVLQAIGYAVTPLR